LISIGGQAEHGHLWFGDVFGRRFQTFRNDWYQFHKPRNISIF
jgi:hypothetical protein